MPEGPEVKLVQRKLSKLLKNNTLLDFKILSGRYKIHQYPKNYNLFKSSLPSKVINVFCKGKFIYMWFENKFHLWNTLGMTGTWSTKKTVHSRVLLKFKSFYLYFNDIRNFGTIKFTFNPKSIQDKLTLIGPDILQLDTNPEFLLSRLKKLNLKKLLQNYCLIKH
jgi:formamidopyrimidine-DNA glycosylase